MNKTNKKNKPIYVESNRVDCGKDTLPSFTFNDYEIYNPYFDCLAINIVDPKKYYGLTDAELKTFNKRQKELNKEKKDKKMEECEVCRDYGFILSNDQDDKNDLQRCDTCNEFESDEQAKQFVLKFINKGERESNE